MTQTLHDLERALGADTARAMASIFASEWRKKGVDISSPALPPEGQARALKRQGAHDLVTNAGSLGFNELSTSARRLEQAILKGDALETASAAAPIPALADAAIAHLTQRYGPL
jgi:HPt (histidine-containing phosphotransfer) domain-containing protein